VAEPEYTEIDFLIAVQPRTTLFGVVESLRLLDALVLHDRLVMPTPHAFLDSMATDPVTGPLVDAGVLEPRWDEEVLFSMQAMELTEYEEFQGVDARRWVAGQRGIVASLYNNSGYVPPLGMYWRSYADSLNKELARAVAAENDAAVEHLALGLARVQAIRVGQSISSEFVHQYERLRDDEAAIAQEVRGFGTLVPVAIPPLAAIVLDRSGSLADVGKEALKLRADLADARARFKELTDVIRDESRPQADRIAAHERLQRALARAYAKKASGTVTAIGLAGSLYETLKSVAAGWAAGTLIGGSTVGSIVGAAVPAEKAVVKAIAALQDRKERREVEYLTSIRSWSRAVDNHPDLIAKIFGIRPTVSGMRAIEGWVDKTDEMQIEYPPAKKIPPGAVSAAPPPG
jgi:hypothetical protein